MNKIYICTVNITINFIVDKYGSSKKKQMSLL